MSIYEICNIHSNRGCISQMLPCQSSFVNWKFGLPETDSLALKPKIRYSKNLFVKCCCDWAKSDEEDEKDEVTSWQVQMKCLSVAYLYF